MAKYKNPVLRGFYPDPSICRVGDTFYMVNSTFAYFPGVPVFFSKNLGDWKQIGNVLDRKSQLPLENCGHSEGIYAPSIRYSGGKYYLITTNVGAGGNFVVAAEHPEGPWSEPHYLGEEAKGIDPSLFFDEDGTCWYIGQRQNSRGSAYFGDCEIWIRRMNTEKFVLEGEEYVVLYGFQKKAVWPEGPHLYKKDGYYYILHAEGGTEENHCVVAARSRKVTGPYEYCPFNPILTHRHLGKKAAVTCVGHGDLVDDGHGNWYMVVLGCRLQNGYTLLGRETFLARVEWENDWPVVNPGVGMLEELVEIPGELENEPKKPDGSEKIYHFREKKLPLEFVMLRNHSDGAITLDEREGYLRLNMEQATLKEKKAPSYVGIRQQSRDFCVKTEMELHCSKEKDCAGLVYLQDNENHIRFEISERNGKKYFCVISCQKGADRVSGEMISEGDTGNRIFLCIKVNGLQASFYWEKAQNREKGSCLKDWNCVAENVDIRHMSTEIAGGFTGCTAGMYASSNGEKSDGYADYDSFTIWKDVR